MAFFFTSEKRLYNTDCRAHYTSVERKKKATLSFSKAFNHSVGKLKLYNTSSNYGFKASTDLKLSDETFYFAQLIMNSYKSIFKPLSGCIRFPVIVS